MREEVIEVSCAIVMEGERVLATQRSEEMPHPLKWEFPGGKLNPGETPENCIIREIREELGVEITVEQLLPSVKHAYPANTIKLIPFVCHIKKGEISLSEHSTYRWVHRSALDQLDWLEADVEILEMVDRYC